MALKWTIVAENGRRAKEADRDRAGIGYNGGGRPDRWAAWFGVSFALAVYDVTALISQARKLAADYRRATGKPLGGVSVEIAEADAARLLDLELVGDPSLGYDAVGRGEREGRRIQIKGRMIADEAKSGQRIGQLKMDAAWDSVVLVLMDEEYEPYEIYEATREEIEAAGAEGEGSRRNKRGAMSVAKFKIIANLVWTREEGVIDDEIWDNTQAR